MRHRQVVAACAAAVVGLHLSADAHRRLGFAVAGKIRTILE